MQADIRNHGQVKWKHVMHLIRLLISGIYVLKDGFVPVDVGSVGAATWRSETEAMCRRRGPERSRLNLLAGV